MKKIVSILLAIIMIACSKTDEAGSLSGTRWEASKFGVLISLQFTSDTECRIVTTSDKTATTLYKYTYKKPDVKLIPLGNDFSVILEAKIIDNIVTVSNPTIEELNKVIYTLFKQ